MESEKELILSTEQQKIQAKHYFKRQRQKGLNASIENKLPNELRGCLKGWNEGNDDTYGYFYMTNGD